MEGGKEQGEVWGGARMRQWEEGEVIEGRGEQRGGGGSEHCEGAGLRGLRAGLPAGVERRARRHRGRKPGCGRELHEVPASLLSFLRIES